MASENEYSCEEDPNFAVICAFLEKFGSQIGVSNIDFLELQQMLENVIEVPKDLSELLIKLLRKIKKTVHIDRWEKTLVKVCHMFSSQDAWEVERFGYKKAKLSSKVRILKELLEMQFDYNPKFKAEINKIESNVLRSQPLGRDKMGHAYWYQSDENYQIRVFKEDLDDEKWTLVAKDRAGLISLINSLSDGDTKISSDSAGNEDSNSLSEKPIIDTGQQDSESKKSTDDSDDSNQIKKEEEDGCKPPPVPETQEPASPKRARDFDEDELVHKYKIKNLDVVVSDIAKTAIVSEEITEPVVKIQGEGSGADNDCPVVIGEVIEEDVVYFLGRGSGHDCLTGKTTEESDKSDSVNSISEKNECNSESKDVSAECDGAISSRCDEPVDLVNKSVDNTANNAEIPELKIVSDGDEAEKESMKTYETGTDTKKTELNVDSIKTVDGVENESGTNTVNSKIGEDSEQDKIVEEPVCIKKVAYVCGSEDNGSEQNEKGNLAETELPESTQEVTPKDEDIAEGTTEQVIPNKEELVQNNEPEKATAEDSSNKAEIEVDAKPEEVLLTQRSEPNDEDEGDTGNKPGTPTDVTDVDKKSRSGESSVSNSPAPSVEENSVISVELTTGANSDDVQEIQERDPLAVSEPEEVVPKPAASLTSFSLDFDETSSVPAPIPIISTGMRNVRKRGRTETPSATPEADNEGKRLKLKGRRQVDQALRKSVEQRKEQLQGSSSSDSKDSEEETSAKSKKSSHLKKKSSVKEKNDASDGDSETTTSKAPVKKKVPRKSRILAGLEISNEQFNEPPIRQSRRLAQLKIREQFEPKKPDQSGQEKFKSNKKFKDDDDNLKAEKRKRNKHDKEENSEPEVIAERKKKKKKEKPVSQLFNEHRPWQSSSDDSEDGIEEEEEEIIEEDYDPPLDLDPKSDHEFSPESDLENDEDWQPLKRARTARKESDTEETDDCPCQKCGKSDHPEWILLCDKCDNGWHCSCLRPPLLVIPEGEWFCPPCQHIRLLEQLQAKLIDYDKMLNKKEIEDRRKERLAYVGISLNNVLPSKEPSDHRKKKRRHSNEGSSSSSEEYEDSRSDSDSDSDEPIYQLRQRRQAKSYKFNEYDEMIKTAIGEDVDKPQDTAGNLGRGKDIQTIVKGLEPEPTAPNGPSVEEPERPPICNLKKMLRKKHRKLNSLEIDSEDEDISDEDFHGTSSESEDEEEELDDDATDDSDDFRVRKGRKNAPTRRSTRARVRRYDADFINDDSDSEEAPQRKKKRSIWDESDSEESETGWGRRNKKDKKKSKKKQVGRLDDSDLEPQQKKSRPRIKYGGLTSSEEEDLGRGRRTRGKKATYVDTLDSESDEDTYKKNSKKIESDEDDEDFVANDEDDVEEEDKDSEGKDDNDVDEEYEEERMEKRALIVPKIYIKKPLGDKKQVKTKHEESTDKLAGAEEVLTTETNGNGREQFSKKAELESALQRSLREAAEELEKDDLEAQKLEDQQGPVNQDRQFIHNPGFLHQPKISENSFRDNGKAAIVHEPIVGNVTALIRNDDENEDLSEPPGISLPLFEELAPGNKATLEETPKKRRGRGPGKNKRSLEESLASLTSKNSAKMSPDKPAIEIAAPPQPFSQAQPTPSVITRMLQCQPGQATLYPVGTIRPKQFATMPDDDSDEPSPSDADSREPSPSTVPPHHIGGPVPMPNHYIPGAPRGPPPMGRAYRPPAPAPANLNHYPRGMPPPHMRAPPPHMYHPLPAPHRMMDPSSSAGGTINIPEPPVSRQSTLVAPSPESPGGRHHPPISRYPPVRPTMTSPRPPMHMAPQPVRHNVIPYPAPSPNNGPPPGLPPDPYYENYPPPLHEDAMPPTDYENSPYPEPYVSDGPVNPPSDNSNSKPYEEESGGEFGGLVSYFSSQREDDLES